MGTIIIICLISLILGIVTGNYLSRRGITAENALNQYQKNLIWLVIGLGLIVLIFLLIGKYRLSYIIPLIIRLLIGAYLVNFVISISCFIFGFLLGLEITGYRSKKRMIELSLGLIIITIPLSILISYALPITSHLKPLKVLDGVVLQTTNSTCAPATIATLARWFGDQPHLSEKDVVKLTKTNHFGTNTLKEISALAQLGLNPQYQERLTFDDLIRINKPALLHVRENINGSLIGHAVALLSIYPDKRIVKIGNPLYGIQEKTEAEMKNYWLGEAIFIQAKIKFDPLT